MTTTTRDLFIIIEAIGLIEAQQSRVPMDCVFWLHRHLPDPLQEGLRRFAARLVLDDPAFWGPWHFGYAVDGLFRQLAEHEAKMAQAGGR